MAFFKKTRVANSEASQYASAEDFRQVFSEDRDVLYRLSLLLTDPNLYVLGQGRYDVPPRAWLNCCCA